MFTATLTGKDGVIDSARVEGPTQQDARRQAIRWARLALQQRRREGSLTKDDVYYGFHLDVRNRADCQVAFEQVSA
jgi:hypothetical protein